MQRNSLAEGKLKSNALYRDNNYTIGIEFDTQNVFHFGLKLKATVIPRGESRNKKLYT